MFFPVKRPDTVVIIFNGHNYPYFTTKIKTNIDIIRLKTISYPLFFVNITSEKAMNVINVTIHVDKKVIIREEIIFSKLIFIHIIVNTIPKTIVIITALK
jgi:hypothetical protein